MIRHYTENTPSSYLFVTSESPSRKRHHHGANCQLSPGPIDYLEAFARHPVVSFAGFTALLTIGCFHITWGWAKWLGFTPDEVTSMDSERPLRKKRRWYIINTIAASLTGLWMAGSFGVIAKAGPASGWLAKQYDEMFRRVPIFGAWL